VLTFLISLFLFIISRKERTALYLGFTFAALTVFNVGYLLGYGLDHPAGAAGWHIACVIVLVVLFKIQFVYYLPEKLNKYEPRIVLWTGLLIYLFIQVQYTLSANAAGYRFNFKNQIYASEYISPYVPILTFVLFIWLFAVQIRQMLKFTKNDHTERSILLRFFFRVFLPVSREGRLIRSFLILTFFELTVNITVAAGFLTSFVSHIVMNLMMSSGLMLIYLAYTVVYVNSSRKNVTFMIKIAGVALVFLLVVSSFIGSRSISRTEESYDRENLSLIKGIISNPDWQKNSMYADNLEYAVLRKNTMGMYSQVYRVIWHTKGKINNELLLSSDESDRQFNLRNLVRKIQNQNRGISAAEAEKRSIDRLNETVLSENQRYYRMAGKERYIYYIIKSDRDSFMEFGFSYREYRKRIHDTVIIETLTLGFLVFLLLTVFPLFFRINLVLPLRRLLEGVKEINEGNLKVHVKVDVYDEIGFLTNSFNNMVSSIESAQNQLEDYAKNLEIKVDERTRQLQDSLNKINDLKTKQDADYFLSSLLVGPLSHPGFSTPSVRVDFKIKQKKEFEFKKKKHEIGGDYCTTVRLRLQNRDCTVILNADAMGKSLQGNGGIIVLGSLFQSIISRTKVSDSMRNLTPRGWMKTVYQELQSVFISFDGSMLVSVFMGVLEEDTGQFFHINAEHPEAVLFRDKKAAFISEEKPEYKIGVELQGLSLTIRETLLRPGDIVIAGSDGRDDILVPEEKTDASSSESKTMNFNEKIFIQTVERTEGDLEKIIREIQSLGEITDDLSLLRMEYFGGGSRTVVNLDRLSKFLQKEFSVIFLYIHFDESAGSSASSQGIHLYIKEIENELEMVFLSEEFEKLSSLDLAFISKKEMKNDLNHSEQAVRAAVKSLQYIESFNAKHSVKFSLRIGIHSVKSLELENSKAFLEKEILTAKQIETAGEFGKIRVSESVHDLMQASCKFQSPKELILSEAESIKTYNIYGVSRKLLLDEDRNPDLP
ncbi:MAG TPA: SpoIIE family protein phosphatase, partial [Leptospiraceae bacterium]|nr:SpoIIE family protein phosphatase [Leptospiraceae bacterium]